VTELPGGLTNHNYRVRSGDLDVVVRVTSPTSALLDELFRAGADLDIRAAGYYAIEAMRLEKGYRAFGRELTTETGPVAAGLTFACKLATDVDFLGRTAVEAARVVAPPRRVVSFVVGDPTAYPWGGELVLRDGRPVGQVTSAAWGGTIGAGVGLALVGDREVGEATGEWVRTGEWTVDVAGDRHPVTVGLRPPLDPLGLRLRRAASTRTNGSFSDH
jgi:4-methylaminobutanoate oxidase (formaldehyde-forming)